MKIIPPKEGATDNIPSEPFPDTAKSIVFNGTVYIVYESEDEVPVNDQV